MREVVDWAPPHTKHSAVELNWGQHLSILQTNFESDFVVNATAAETPTVNINNNLAATSEKTEEGANLKGEVIEIVTLIRDINYKAIKKRTKRLVRKKGRYGEPQSLTEALKSPLSGQWFKTILDELTQLLEFGIFKFLPRSQLPKGRKALTSRVVYRQKVNKEGKITKLKARLVVRGFL